MSGDGSTGYIPGLSDGSQRTQIQDTNSQGIGPFHMLPGIVQPFGGPNRMIGHTKQRRRTFLLNAALTVAGTSIAAAYQFSTPFDATDYNEMLVTVALYTAVGQTGSWTGCNLIIQVADSPTGAFVWPIDGSTKLYTAVVPSPVASSANQILGYFPFTNFGNVIRLGIGGVSANTVNVGTVYLNVKLKG